MDVTTLPLAFRTAQHLKPSQLAARMLRLVKRRLAPLSSLRKVKLPHASAEPAAQVPDVPLIRDSECQGDRILHQLRECQLGLLNQCFEFDPHSPDWRLGTRQQDRLWSVTLHYHEWLFSLAKLAADDNADAAEMFHSILSDWLEKCDISSAGSEDLAWNAYAIATRLEWWIRSIEQLGPDYWTNHTSFLSKVNNSLWQQAHYLSRHLEWDLRANHLLRDAIGLAWAGRYFSGRHAQRWLRTATSLAVSQAREQVLADGGHFERSPMYHLEVMHDFEVLEHLLTDPIAKTMMQNVVSRMNDVACWLRHPDGQIAQLNDTSRRLYKSTEPLPHGGRYFHESGVAVFHCDPWTVFFDTGKVGPDYQPGHAHADTLTVECSYAGRRLFVDPGCYSYDNDSRRRYDRATSSHNTVSIDGMDSSEVWHIFRVGRRANPLNHRAEFTSQTMNASAGHDGFRRLRGRPAHYRSVQVDDHARLRIVDEIQGAGEHTIQGGYLLEPGWEVEALETGWRLQNGSSNLTVQVRGSQALKLSTESRPIHRQFGIEEMTARLCWSCRGSIPLRVETEVAEPADGQDW